MMSDTALWRESVALTEQGSECCFEVPLARSLQRLQVRVRLPGIERQRLEFQLEQDRLTIFATADATVAALKAPEIVGDSEALQNCRRQLASAAAADHAVLICGETGTGKALFARVLHRHSSRQQEPLVVVDCRSLSESVAVPLLLGRLRGQHSSFDGLLNRARRGTLLLDAVDEMPLRIQRLFSTILRSGSFQPQGARRAQPVDFRLLATSNQDLEQLITQHRFLPTLLEQVQAQCIEIPPLREHLSDIDQLAETILQRLCRQWELPERRVAPEFLQLLKRYPWPGNVRELENSIGQALLSARGARTLFPKDLPVYIRVQVKKRSLKRRTRSTGTEPAAQTRWKRSGRVPADG